MLDASQAGYYFETILLRTVVFSLSLSLSKKKANREREREREKNLLQLPLFFQVQNKRFTADCYLMIYLALSLKLYPIQAPIVAQKKVHPFCDYYLLVIVPNIPLSIASL